MKFFIFLTTCTCLYANPSTVDKFRTAQIAFQKGNCQAVIDNLLPNKKILPEQIFADSQLKSALSLLGICYFEKKEIEAAGKTFKKLIYLDPEFKLDAFSTPPKTLTFFEKEKSTTLAKLKQITQAQKKLELVPSKQAIKLIRDSNKKDYFAAFVPFGYPQFKQKNKITGTLLAISQIGLIGTNIGAYWWKQSYLSSQSGQIANQADLEKYNLAQGIQIGAIAVLGATYLFGVIDAFIHMGI